MKKGPEGFDIWPYILLMTVSALLSGLLDTDRLSGHPEPNPTPFEPAGRDQWQLPDSVVAALGLKPGDRVADIGASSGYFSRRFSPAVGAAGRVYAADVDLEVLGWLAARARDLGLANLDTVHARPDDPLLPVKVNLIFFCNTLHHIQDRPAYLRNLRKYLDPGGRVAVVDFYKKDLPVGPKSPEHKLAREESEAAFNAAGYRIVERFDFLPYQYMFIAAPE